MLATFVGPKPSALEVTTPSAVANNHSGAISEESTDNHTPATSDKK